MCDFPTGYFLPGQLSRNRGSTDKPHLVQMKRVRNRNAKNVEWMVISLLKTLGRSKCSELNAKSAFFTTMQAREAYL